jgi:hypothetical protein
MRVVTIVREICSSCWDEVHKARLATVVAVVQGIVRAGRLSAAVIGRNLTTKARPKHSIKRVDRLLGNFRWRAERWKLFRAIAAQVIRNRQRPLIIVDWTQAVGTQRALVAAAPIGGRAIPLHIEVHPEKDLGNAKVQTKFLHRLREVLPTGCRPIVISDAGFHGPFFSEVRRLGWDFLGRLRGTAKARVISDGSVVSKEDLYRKATLTPKDLGEFDLYTSARSVRTRLVLVRHRRRPGRKLPPPRSKDEREYRASARDPWLLVTSLDAHTAAAVVKLYAKRMQIEETFRDAKSHRFGWSLRSVRTDDIHRTAMLLLLATLAMLVVTLIGLAAERRGDHRGYQANTVRRRVLSFFSLGNAIIMRGAKLFLSLRELRATVILLGEAASL